MKVLSIVSQKGGTGKTTLATHLSVEAERHGQTTALIDLDPQASAAKWGDHRQAESPAVVATPASRLKHWLEIAKNNGATFAIIDTPPNTEASILEIAKVSSLVLIPCQPSLADVDAIQTTVTLVKISEKPASVVLSRVPANTDLDLHARKAIRTHYEVAVAPCQIGNRVGFIHAYNSGATVGELEPSSKSAAEIHTLYAYLEKQMENGHG